ncbi:MAG TPA: outer membrane lipid asymmetry maintenance protein MlaD [Nitrospirota bacterium]|jgi:phospholipid/cholesterol/gamma-HCH transport system substrate-binding protein
MNRYSLEVLVGVFVLVGLIALGYLSIKLGKMEVLGSKGYDIVAEFSDIGGLKAGSSVEIAGVEVGRVTTISLKDYQALVRVRMNEGVKLQDDSIASIKTKGLIGEKFMQLTPGGSDSIIKPGGRLRETESAIDFESLISNYIFGKVQ